MGLGGNLFNENLLLRWFEPLCEAIRQCGSSLPCPLGSLNNMFHLSL